jgi:hypothetical protein
MKKHSQTKSKPHAKTTHKNVSRQTPDESSPNSAQELLSLTGEFKTARDVNRILGKLWEQVVKGKISRADASTLAYIGQLLLQTLHPVHCEITSEGGTRAWQETLHEVSAAFRAHQQQIEVQQPAATSVSPAQDASTSASCEPEEDQEEEESPENSPAEQPAPLEPDPNQPDLDQPAAFDQPSDDQPNDDQPDDDQPDDDQPDDDQPNVEQPGVEPANAAQSDETPTDNRQPAAFVYWPASTPRLRRWAQTRQAIYNEQLRKTPVEPEQNQQLQK